MLEISFALPEPIHIRKYKFTRRQQDSKSNNLIVRQASYRINSTSNSHTDHSLASIDNVFFSLRLSGLLKVQVNQIRVTGYLKSTMVLYEISIDI